MLMFLGCTLGSIGVKILLREWGPHFIRREIIDRAG